MLQRPRFPTDGIALNGIQHSRRQHEKSAIDPAAIAQWFLLKTSHPFLLQLQGAEAPWRQNGSHGRQPGLRSMESDQRRHVHVSYAIAIGKAEILIIQVPTHPP